ncbi:NUDIX family hydrolase [Alteracholeplasma palmae J233]|uniref:NUDIX family hydrolase n=1 Tax=Alteracholeplasma palmae (strain ATCC 49389 / J233) TaxID=1318466 RepID=U4KQZ2_ALTPJ|nr:NUDIX domain-containing protein [Alteracholeplasma palmae]CCV63726.1 NUDIX family hydrolase [Alteracholeplasma palmae J233]
MEFKYCPTCGEKLIKKEIGDEGFVSYCNHCQRPWFNVSYSTIIALVVNEKDEVLLLKQDYVIKDSCVLVAGYYKEKETLEQTAKREVYEETGQEVIDLQYVQSYYHDKNDLIISGYIAKVQAKPLLKSIEVDELKWVKSTEAQQYLKFGSIAHKLLISYLEKRGEI